MKRASILLLWIAMIATPAFSQGIASKGEEFLNALRKSDDAKAMQIVEESGFTLVNHRGADGSTGLHIVIRNRNPSWVNYLLEKGADKNLGDKRGDTPLILAARSGYGEGVGRLLVGRALIDKTNRQGETALIVAVQQRHAAIVSILLKLGADPDKRDFAAGYSARDYAKRDSRTSEMLKLIETVKPRATETGKSSPAR